MPCPLQRQRTSSRGSPAGAAGGVREDSPVRRFAIAGFVLVAIAAAAASASPASSAPQPRTAAQHLQAILDRSRPPEYRRAGSAGMRAVQDYVDQRLADAGYATSIVGGEFPRYAVDYRRGHAPALTRVSDGRSFKTESAFYLGRTTGPRGITCTVRAVTDVGRGDCGFVPFRSASPEWKNTPFVTARADIDEIVRRGGVGAIVQGDTARHLVYSITLRESIPSVVSVVEAADVVGTRVRLRAMGQHTRGDFLNVVGVRRPARGASGYVLLLAHGDGWFQAAADNGTGTAAVLRAAELLAARRPATGVMIAVVDAEEVGLLGSKHLVDVLRGSGVPFADGGPPVRMGDLKAVVNLDASSARASDAQPAQALVLGGGPVFSWRAFVSSDGSPLGALFARRAVQHGVYGLPVGAQAWLAAIGSWRTDAGWFDDAGVPVVWPVAGYPEYHTDGDTMATVDAADLEAVAQAAADTALDAASLPR